jgi:diguanylate cyclase (GGDEF)-like protein
MAPKFSSLKIRIVIFFTLLLLALQLADGLLLNTAGTANTRKTLGEELQTGERVFHRLIDQNALQLTRSARLMSADFAFREALATGDRETIVSALSNHGGRINAQVMMLIGLNRKVIADTTMPTHVGETFAFTQSIGKASVMTLIDGHLHQLVVVPVLAPAPVAWVAMGFRIDDKTTQDLQKLTGLEVSLLSHRNDEGWKVDASTLPPAQREFLATQVTDDPQDEPYSLILPDSSDEYVTLVSTQVESGDERVVAVLQSSLDTAMAPFHRLLRNLMLLSAIAIAVSILGSFVIARGIARPVEQLAAFARRIASGDYSDPPSIKRGDEIGDLSQAFEHMRDGIVSREAKITDLAYRDPLTRLPNRTLFNDRLIQAISIAQRQDRSLAVLVVNLDDFRRVNDALGHRAGDQLLCEVAKRLQAVIKRQSDTVARLGSDDFAILLPGDDSVAAEVISKRLLRALEAPILIEQQPVDVRASIGIAIFPEHGDESDTLVTNADIALSLAKRNNSGFAIFDKRYEERSVERLSLMGELRHAVERDELIMYYQPKVDLKGKGELRAEALVRWQHPQRGFIPPMEFIPFAEQTGYIKAITLWVLNRSIAQCSQWRRDGLAINFSINLSTRDLLNPELEQKLKDMLVRHDCKPEWITLEITESAIIDDPDRALRNLDQLHALGFRLAIDDFGTGYSSLSYLKRLPVDELKIDKSFVLGMVKDQDDHVIVRSTIDLAHNMGLEVVAEGVESLEIFDSLRELGCDIAQGYLISKPITAADFEQFMNESPWLHTLKS